VIEIPAAIQNLIWQATGISEEMINQAEPKHKYYFFQQHQMQHFLQLLEEHYKSRN
jgi:predicted TPR repeat methyltransferase